MEFYERFAMSKYASQRDRQDAIADDWENKHEEINRLKSDIAVRDQYVEELRQRERELLGRLDVAREALTDPFIYWIQLQNNATYDHHCDTGFPQHESGEFLYNVADALNKLEEK